MTPRIIAPGRTSVGVMLATLICPNFSEAAVHVANFPWRRLSKIAMKKTAEELETNVFQSIENFQKGLGYESSKKNRAPPIGAPNATLTPAEAPAAMNYLFLWSLCKNLSLSPNK